MRRSIMLALPVAAALLLPAAYDPPGHRDPAQQEFAKLLDSADKAFARKDFIASAQSLQQGIMVANGMLRSSVRNSMPIPPRGFVEIAMPEPTVNPSDPIGAAVALNPNRPIEQRYRRSGGVGEIRLIVSPHSPAARAIAHAISRVEDDPSSELVEAGTWIGVLTARRDDFSVRFVIGDGHVVEVRAHGIDNESVLKMVDVNFLNRVAQTLGS